MGDTVFHLINKQEQLQKLQYVAPCMWQLVQNLQLNQEFLSLFCFSIFKGKQKLEIGDIL